MPHFFASVLHDIHRPAHLPAISSSGYHDTRLSRHAICQQQWPHTASKHSKHDRRRPILIQSHERACAAPWSQRSAWSRRSQVHWLLSIRPCASRLATARRGLPALNNSILDETELHIMVTARLGCVAQMVRDTPSACGARDKV